MGQDLGGLVFFSLMREYIKHQLDKYVSDAVERVIGFTGALALALLTMWIMIEGYRIMTGQSRTPLIGFVMQAGKMVVIISIATSSALYNEWVRDTLDDVRDDITYFITGSHQNVYRQVDKNLALTQTIMSTVNSIATNSTTDGFDAKEDQKRAWWLSAFGSGGPAIVAGMVSLLNEIMLSLAVVFGPIFILGLLFEQTKQLFWNWVKYCIGVMFSMGVLAIMTSITLKISIGYATAVVGGILTQSILGVGSGPSVSQTAMIQGGIGLMLTTLLITVPPMVMTFFSVSLGGAVSGFGPWASNAGAPPGTGMDKKEQQNSTASSDQASRGGAPSADSRNYVPGTQQANASWENKSAGAYGATEAAPPPRSMEAVQADLSRQGYSWTSAGNIYRTGDFTQNANRARQADAGAYTQQIAQRPEAARLQTELQASMREQSSGTAV